MAVQVLHWRFTVEDYARMLESGILSEDDRVELIDGEVRAMAPISSRHAAAVRRLSELIRDRIGKRAIVSVQNPIRLNDYTEPQPDIAVLRRREDFYASAHPGPEDTLLVIEVADASAEYDREEKVPRYARAMIPEAWLADVEAETVTQYTEPDGTRYRHVRTWGRGQTIVSQSVSGIELSVDSLFG
ncbi:MAG: Uma2 family endonuclease [Chloroflexi bacterium]|nr:Uma2 family endonuclease [Chloroflexota bacterium]